MDIAHLHQESTLPLLKEWLERGIFTKEEIKLIVRRREKFEAALLGSFQRKTDYLKYVEYEMTLHMLLKKRMKRLNVQIGASPLSDASGLSGRIFSIFERALRRFKSDVSLWVEYIQAAKKLKARNLVPSLCARAVQQHPTSPALFLLSASNELARGSYSAARSFLQRGLRLNPESVKLWTEYVKMELNYTESLRRKQREVSPSEDKTKEIVSDGAIVKTVMAQAMKDVKDLSIFYSLQTLIQKHPSPLRSSYLDELYKGLISHHPSSSEARVLYASRLMDVVESDSPAFVDGLRNANEELVDAMKKFCQAKDDAPGREMVDAYVRWVEKQVVELEIDDLKRYIILSLTSVVSQISSTIHTSSLLRACLQLSLHPSLFPSSTDPEYGTKLLKRARKYTSPSRKKGSSSRGNKSYEDEDQGEEEEEEGDIWRDPEVWIARMSVEKVCASSVDEVRDAWREGRKVVKAKRMKDGNVDAEEVVKFWMWGVWNLERGEDAFEELLRESKAHSLVTRLHTSLLLHYIQQKHPQLSPSERLRNLGSILSDDFPSSSFFQPAFAFESSLAATTVPISTLPCSVVEATARKEIRPILELIFERWRIVKGEEEVASRAWAEWLVRNGFGDEAGRVVRMLVVGAGRRSGEREEVEKWWNRVLNSLSGGREVEGGIEAEGAPGGEEIEVDDEVGGMEMGKTTMMDEGDVIWF